MLFCYQCGPLFVVVYLPSGSLFWVRSQRSIWESNTSRFHLGCWISKWVTGVFLWNGVPSPGSWSLGHMPFMVLICFLVTCHTHMYLHLFVLMIGQLLYNNFVCMAIKNFWLDLTWLDLTWLLQVGALLQGHSQEYHKCTGPRFNLKTVSSGIEIPYSDKIIYTKTVCRSLSKYMSNFDGFSVFLSFNGTFWNNRCN